MSGRVFAKDIVLGKCEHNEYIELIHLLYAFNGWRNNSKKLNRMSFFELLRGIIE